MPSIARPPSSANPPQTPTLSGTTPAQAMRVQSLPSSRTVTWHGGGSFAAEAARQLNARRAHVAITSHQHNAWTLQQQQEQQQEQYRQQQQALEAQHRQQQLALQQQQQQQQQLEQALRQELHEEEERAIMNHRLSVQRQAEQHRRLQQQQQHGQTETDLQALEALLSASAEGGVAMQDQRAEPPSPVHSVFTAGTSAGAGTGARAGAPLPTATANMMDSGAADDIYSLLFGGPRPQAPSSTPWDSGGDRGGAGASAGAGGTPTSISPARRQSTGDAAHTHTWHDSRPNSVRRLSDMLEERRMRHRADGSRSSTGGSLGSLSFSSEPTSPQPR